MKLSDHCTAAIQAMRELLPRYKLDFDDYDNYHSVWTGPTCMCFAGVYLHQLTGHHQPNNWTRDESVIAYALDDVRLGQVSKAAYRFYASGDTTRDDADNVISNRMLEEYGLDHICALLEARRDSIVHIEKDEGV